MLCLVFVSMGLMGLGISTLVVAFQVMTEATRSALTACVYEYMLCTSMVYVCSVLSVDFAVMAS